MLHTELSIGEYFRAKVAEQPDHDFIVYPDRDLRWTYAEFDERTDRLAKGLLAIGMEPGDHLGVWARNVPDWLTFMFATAKIGVVLVTVNPVYKSHELAYVMKQSDMKALCIIDAFRDVDYIEIVRGLVPEAATHERGRLDSKEFPKLKNLIYMGPEKHRGFYTVPELLVLGEHLPDDGLKAAAEKFDQNSTINMQYTSGTTGFPKGVMLTSRNILNNGFFIGERQKLTSDDRICIPVPLFHCFGCVLGVLAALTHGSTLVMVEQWDPRHGACGGAEGARDRALRRAHDVHRRTRPPDVRDVRSDLAAHRHHGRLAVPDRDDAAGHRPHARHRDHHRLRPHGGLAGLHADLGRRRRSSTSARRWARSTPRSRCAWSTRRPARTARRTSRASCSAAATTS